MNLPHIKTPRASALILTGLIMALNGCLAACSSETENVKITPTALMPTLLPEVSRGYEMRANNACLIADYTPITSNKKQGDLMSWKPDSHTLAYVGPQNNSWAWYLGALYLVDPVDKKTLYASSNIKVSGDLSWSPSGEHIAMVAMQSSQEYFTALVLQPEANQVYDLFPGQAAQTDTTASQKGILEWTDSRHLTASTSCGVDCVQHLNFDASGVGKQLLEEIRTNEDHSLDLTINQPEYDMESLPVMDQANWSPDGNWIFYVDTDYQTWLLNLPGKYQFILMDTVGLVRETKWSPDSQYLAVRKDNHITVFKMDCQNHTGK